MGFLQDVGRLFGVVKPKKVESYTYGGPKPYASLKEIPETQKYLTELEGRIAGRGVGFRPEVLSATTAPYAESMRRGYQKYVEPNIYAQASARGLGRSTIPIGQARLGGQEVETEIGKRVADVSLANEEQIRQEINDALARYGIYPAQEAATRAGAAEFGYKSTYEPFKDYTTRRDLSEAEYMKNLANKGVPLVTGLASAGAGALAGLPMLAPISGLLKSASTGLSSMGELSKDMTNDDYSNILAEIFTRKNKALVNK